MCFLDWLRKPVVVLGMSSRPNVNIESLRFALSESGVVLRLVEETDCGSWNEFTAEC